VGPMVVKDQYRSLRRQEGSEKYSKRVGESEVPEVKTSVGKLTEGLNRGPSVPQRFRETWW
jgi:hypothetical protein